MPFTSKRPVLLGDGTTHGGIVTSASGQFSINGRRVAVRGDSVQCPQCGTTTIVEGDETLKSGAAVALHGHATSCGAKLISCLTR